jgi:hypothetical protein
MDAPALMWLMAQRLERLSNDVQALAEEFHRYQVSLGVSRPPRVRPNPSPLPLRMAILAIVAQAGPPHRVQDVLQVLHLQRYKTTLPSLRSEVSRLVRDGQIRHVGRNQYQAAS